MSSLLAHRGPDGSGLFIDKNYGVIHRRLSVIDLLARSDQPMIDRKTGNVISYNGECYNYKELRSQLEGLGETFDTESDTEVVLKGVGRMGQAFIEDMDGQFAFAFWFKRERNLWLVRDRLGIKPLYYSVFNEQLLFSSEIKPILNLRNESSLNVKNIPDFFRFRYSQSEETFFSKVKKVNPATIIQFDPNLRIEEKKYWDLRGFRRKKEKSFSNHQVDIYDAFEESVKIRTRSDVRVASYLSSGVDSSAIVDMASRTGKVDQIFCYKSKGTVDEVKKAKELAHFYSIAFNVVNDESTDIIGNYRKCLRALEEPIGDSIIWPSYLLAQFVSKNNKVVLSGEGADEVFGGYVHHFVLQTLSLTPSMIFKLLKQLNSDFVSGQLNFIVNRLGIYPGEFDKNITLRLLEFIKRKRPFGGQSMLQLFYLFDDNEIQTLFSLEKLESSPAELFIDQCENRSPLEKITLNDLRYWSPDYTLHRLDRLSMVHGLEARVPFYSHKVIEKSLELKDHHKIYGLQRKRVLREILKTKSRLPSSVVKHKKMPFVFFPEKAMGSKFLDAILEVVLDPSVKKLNFVKAKELEAFVTSGEGSLQKNKQLFCLFIFFLWHDEFFG